MGEFFKDVNKKEAISWAFYDFANSAYTLLMLSFVFPIFFREVIVGGTQGDFWWGFAVSISILLGGIASPVIGAIADHDTRRKRKFIIYRPYIRTQFPDALEATTASRMRSTLRPSETGMGGGPPDTAAPTNAAISR